MLFGSILLGSKSSKLCKLGVFWNPQDILLKMVTEILKIAASWAEKLTKTRVSFLMNPSVCPTWFESAYIGPCLQFFGRNPG